MAFDLAEWLNLALRWLHLVAGIAWIGSSFYFVWLDNHLTRPAAGDASGELWSVHGGGFYHNQKYQVAPSAMPEQLHWFKWEAYFTWISGFSLLVLIYYVGAAELPDRSGQGGAEPGRGRSPSAWRRWRSAGWSTTCCAARRWGPATWRSAPSGSPACCGPPFCSTACSARARPICMSARSIGTVMVANVFFIIIPNQRKVVADLVAGRTPDPALGAAAKQRSLHNNYMTLPVLFIMISPHYPMTYGAERPWLVLALLGLTGVAVRHVFNLRGRGQPTGPTIVLATALALASVTYVTLEKGGAPRRRRPQNRHLCRDRSRSWPPIARPATVRARPTRPSRAAARPGARQLRACQRRVGTDQGGAVDTETMPLGNATRMTPAERQRLGAWIAAGSPR